MSSAYDPLQTEAKWQAKWSQAHTFAFDMRRAKDPYYCLVMFPYPSGARLHVGHWFQYSIPDSYVRFQRMRGKNVFHPMGFDAFGLPAENYAIKTGTPPDVSTRENVENMIVQFKRMGVSYDWEHSLNTSTPEYYRWTQWLFLQMYAHHLAYKREANVNWCPSCQTVLANEQVKEGACERCGASVVQKNLNQWFWKITQYADRLLAGLDDLDWPEKTKIMQRNWIGRKEGVDISYRVDGTDETVVCFTTRPDTNFGATFIVLAPEHALVTAICNGALPTSDPALAVRVRRYCEQAISKTELERQAEGRKKTGVFTGFYAINNVNGAKMPIWVSDFVLGHFGTGAVVGVPGHDKRDFEFAQTFRLPVLRVVVAPDGDSSPIERIEQVQEEDGIMIHSDFLDGMRIREAKEHMMTYLAHRGWGRRVTSYRLRDWLVSRQRYWGAPIPIVYDPDGNPHPIPEEHLPWMLPTDVAFKPTGKSPLTESKEFIERTEKIFGKGWTPEFDTMDTFVCSSFYYLRFLASNSHKQLVDPVTERTFLPVDLYIGGPEHATMHLIYARFVMMALQDFGFVSHAEPFQKLVHQGLITNQGAKMSKSKGNVVSPDAFVERYGSDVFRMYLMFMGPFTNGGDWSDTGIKGISRFVQRVWHALAERSYEDGDMQASDVTVLLHRTVKKVTEEAEALRFNTAISALMELLNALERCATFSLQTARTLVLLLAPLAPHLAEELWERLGGDGFAIQQPWPTYDAAYLQTQTVTVVVQVNGKVRGELRVSTDASKEEILKSAKEVENVRKYLTGTVRKEVYVPGKLVSLVVEPS